MRRPGQIVLFSFPYADQAKAKFRPALLIGHLPGDYDDWLICMISSQLHHEVKGFDEALTTTASDFSSSGLKTPSLLRLGRLAVLDGHSFVGSIGTISSERLIRIKNKIAEWVKSC